MRLILEVLRYVINGVYVWWVKLYMSMAHPHLKSPWSLSSTSTHPTVGTRRSWSWSWIIDSHHFHSMSIVPPISDICYFKIWFWKTKVKVMSVAKIQGHIVSPASNQLIGGHFKTKCCHFTSEGNSTGQIQQSFHYLITTNGFPISVMWHLHIETRWVDGTPTTEVTPVTIW